MASHEDTIWSEGGRFREASFGPLFLAIEESGPYGKPGEPGYAPAWFQWYVMPDNEDKSHERAYCSSEGGPPIRSLEAAHAGVLEAAAAFIECLSDSLVKLREEPVPQ